MHPNLFEEPFVMKLHKLERLPCLFSTVTVTVTKTESTLFVFIENEKKNKRNSSNWKRNVLMNKTKPGKKRRNVFKNYSLKSLVKVKFFFFECSILIRIYFSFFK
jgi:hypothetical protein